VKTSKQMKGQISFLQSLIIFVSFFTLFSCNSETEDTLTQKATLTKTYRVDPGEDNSINQGDKVYYTFRVENTGNMDLKNLIITDSLLDKGSLTCPIFDSKGYLKPGEVDYCTAEYTLTSKDIDEGKLSNRANVEVKYEESNGQFGDVNIFWSDGHETTLVSCIDFGELTPEGRCNELKDRTEIIEDEDEDVLFFPYSDTILERRGSILRDSMKIEIDHLLSSGYYDENYDTCKCSNGTIFILKAIRGTFQERENHASSDPDRNGKLGRNISVPVEIDFQNLDITGQFASPEYSGLVEDPLLVAVLDSGIDQYAESLLGDILWKPTSPAASCEFLNKQDSIGHGTHVSGIMANEKMTEGSNGFLQLMSLKISSEQEIKLADALCAARYAIEKEAKVINCSWGYYAEKPDSAFLSLIQYGQKRDVTFVVSAGNDGVNIDNCHFWPASFADEEGIENVIAVGAHNINSELTGFSNYGTRTVQLMAPGVDILSLFPFNYYNQEGVYTNIPTEPGAVNCANLTGTSMASPAVARLVAKITYDNRESGAWTSLDLKNEIRLMTTLVPCEGRLKWHRRFLSDYEQHCFN